MKIREILELTKTKPIKDLAKELPVGEKNIRAILKSLNAEPPKVGTSGWTFENVKTEDLERDISEFVRKAKTKKVASNSTNSSKINEHIQNDKQHDKIETNTSKIKNENKGDSSMTNTSVKDEIANMLKGQEKEKPAKRFKGFYLDEDVANAIDNIKAGNKSDVVSKIIRTYLKENNLL
jgi:uncharacterized membrane protein YheB (UPF0754 family)